MKTSDTAKLLMVGVDDLNAIIEDMANRGILYLTNDEGGGVMPGQAQFCTHWTVDHVTIALKAQQKGLPGVIDAEEDGTNPEAEDDENDAMGG
mgnify:CR=1 FL=1